MSIPTQEPSTLQRWKDGSLVNILSIEMKVGIIANEFMDPAAGGMGGFGWAARQLARVFGSSEGHEAVFLSGKRFATNEVTEVELHGLRMLLRRGRRDRLEAFRALQRERIDVLVTIDYRPQYNYWLWMLPRTPVIVWSRDPRTDADVARVATLRIPGEEDVIPGGISKIDCTGIANVAKWSRVLRRRVVIANKLEHLAAKNPGTYGMPASPFVLPNPDVVDSRLSRPPKASRPRVVYLGRLDPIKRPWLFVELARSMPEVEFLAVGQSHFGSRNGVDLEFLPPNVRLTGHLDGQDKIDLLGSAWVLVNTSIHEESPVSVFEALALETPVVSCTDWGGIASRFGAFVGRYDGTGIQAVPALKGAVDRLISDDGHRTELATAGRRWVEENHSDRAFMESFHHIVSNL